MTQVSECCSQKDATDRAGTKQAINKTEVGYIQLVFPTVPHLEYHTSYSLCACRKQICELREFQLRAIPRLRILYEASSLTKKKPIEIKKKGYKCDLICNVIITGNINMSLGCSETSAQVFAAYHTTLPLS